MTWTTKACPAQAVKLVTGGQLENYLIGREPVRDFPQSNGHGRAGITGRPKAVDRRAEGDGTGWV